MARNVSATPVPTPKPKTTLPTRLPNARQLAAAVCYRIGKRGIEFLLVQTRGGRWIFPKGGVKAGLTHAQSAALEAVEEAGVHGRMEEVAFARYLRSKPLSKPGTDSEPEPPVMAHLCEVTRLEPPQESKRNPTWFSAEKAKRRLLEDRTPESGAELARVVERALSRIQRMQGGPPSALHYTQKDALQRVHFDASDIPPAHLSLREAEIIRHFLRGRPDQIRRPVLRLGAGIASPAETARNVTAIDSGPKAVATSGGLPLSRQNVSRKIVGVRAGRRSH